MGKQTFDANDLLGKATEDFLTALQHVMSVIFAGTGWILFLDDKTKRWMLSKGSRDDFQLEAGTDLLNDRMVSFHIGIQGTVNEILRLIGFNHKIFKDDNGSWRLILDDSNMETAEERASKQLDVQRKQVSCFGDGRKGAGRRGHGSFGRRPSEEMSEHEKPSDVQNTGHYGGVFQATEEEPGDGTGMASPHKEPPPGENAKNVLEISVNQKKKRTRQGREKQSTNSRKESRTGGTGFHGRRVSAHENAPNSSNIMEHSEEDDKNEPMDHVAETGNLFDADLFQTANDRDKPQNLVAGISDKHERPSDVQNTGHSGGVFQATEEEPGDGTGMASPQKEPPPEENAKSVSEIIVDQKKKRRQRREKQSTNSRTEARTGGTVKKDFVLKDGLVASGTIVIIEAMPKWPPLTGGRWKEFNKEISKKEKNWIDNTIFKLHYISPTNVLSEEQNSADIKTMQHINEPNPNELNIFVISSLKPGSYLADDIICNYSQALANIEAFVQKESRFYIFTTYFCLHGMKAFITDNLVNDWPAFYVNHSKVRDLSGDLSKRDHLIFPVCNGNHYILLIFNVLRWQLLILDSMNFTDFQREAAFFVITVVKQILYIRAPGRLKRKEVKCYAPKCIPRQPSGTGDCGIFVCMYLDAYVKGISLTGVEWGHEDIINFRYKLARDLVMDDSPSKKARPVQRPVQVD